MVDNSLSPHGGKLVERVMEPEKAREGSLAEPYLLEETSMTILVIGGGITGMTAALGAADAGYNVVLIEKNAELGGWAKKLHKQLPQSYPFETLEEVNVKSIIEKVKTHPNIEVLTSFEIEEMEEIASKGKITRPSDGKIAKRVAFIQYAGSREPNHLPYCSSFCCLTSLKQALYVREKNPHSMAYILYKDMRTPAQYELSIRKYRLTRVLCSPKVK